MKPRVAQSHGWEKVLYRRQGSDDAYTTDAFLEALVVNATVAKRSYRKVVWDSLPVNQQLSTVTLVSTASYLLTQGRLSMAQLLWVQALLAVVGALAFMAAAGRRSSGRTQQREQRPLPPRSPAVQPSSSLCRSGSGGCSQAAAGGEQELGDGIRNGSSSRGARRGLSVIVSPRSCSSGSRQRPKDTQWPCSSPRPRAPTPTWRRRLLRPLCTALCFAGGTLLLSPLYATLAQSVSTDTVVFLSGALLTAHLFLWDYRFAGRLAGSSARISLGCALTASILCASRAGSALAAFYQVTLALQGFVLLPQLRAAVQAASPAAHACLTVALGCAAVAALLPRSILLATSYVCSAAFVSLICPMWLVRVGKFKAQINGPWDEAVPKLSRDVSLRAASPRKGGLGGSVAAVAAGCVAGCAQTQARSAADC